MEELERRRKEEEERRRAEEEKRRVEREQDRPSVLGCLGSDTLHCHCYLRLPDVTALECLQNRSRFEVPGGCSYTLNTDGVKWKNTGRQKDYNVSFSKNKRILCLYNMITGSNLSHNNHRSSRNLSNPKCNRKKEASKVITHTRT
ncbi:unnamed protein product [Ranitomeya imitator]|uniref:Uncharacterized protein n=1 Tax=Ranitomeya imitator TaxID=111125 RepID=A0ABN9MKZ6_9NEOB|nr:unnamed protein product [Ranitomeya imitator]